LPKVLGDLVACLVNVTNSDFANDVFVGYGGLDGDVRAEALLTDRLRWRPSNQFPNKRICPLVEVLDRIRVKIERHRPFPAFRRFAQYFFILTDTARRSAADIR
jgi:hypothetical protein